MTARTGAQVSKTHTPTEYMVSVPIARIKCWQLATSVNHRCVQICMCHRPGTMLTRLQNVLYHLQHVYYLTLNQEVEGLSVEIQAREGCHGSRLCCKHWIF